MASPVGNPYQAVITAIKAGDPGERVFALVTHLLADEPNLPQLRQLEADISVLKSSDPEHEPTPAERVAKFAHSLIHNAHLKAMSTLSQNDKERFIALLQEIDDPETLLELALMSSTSLEPQEIEHYRIANEHDRLKVARTHLLEGIKGDDATLKDYQTFLTTFNITSEEDRGLLFCYFLKLFDQSSIERILSQFDDLHIYAKETRTSIACACVAQFPDLICDVIDQLQLKDDQVNVLILSILRLGNFSDMSALITHLNGLNLSDEAIRRKIALTIAEKYPLLLFPNLEKFNLNLESRILVAHQLAQGASGAQLLEYFQDFEIDDELISFEIIRKIDPRYLELWLLKRNDYPISKPEFRYELYKNFARHNLRSLVQEILKEPNEEERASMIQACAETNPYSLILNYSPEFNLSQASTIKIAEVIARLQPMILLHFLEKTFLDFQLGVRLLRQYPSPSLGYFKTLLNWREKEYLSSQQLLEILCLCIMEGSNVTIKHLHLFLNVLDKKALFELIAHSARVSLPASLSGADHQLCEKIIKEASGYPDLTLVLDAFEQFFIDLTPLRFEHYKRLVTKPGAPPIAHLLLPMMIVALWVEQQDQHPIDRASHDSLDQLRNNLSIKPIRKHFRNTGSTLQKLWLNVLRMFNQDPILTERKSYGAVLLLLTQITHGLDPEDPAKDLIRRLGSLQGIMNARPIGASRDTISPLLENLSGQILQAAAPTKITPLINKAFEEVLASDPYLDLANIEDLSTKYALTFGNTRIPNALQIYESSLKASNDSTVQDPFNDFICLVLNGTYSTVRYEPNNPHKEWLATNHSDMWTRWQKGPNPKPIEIGGKIYELVDTDHWEPLFLCGTDTGTCQSLDNPDMSRGLLGTLLDGTNRMVGMIDPVTQKTAARALIRLLINKKTGELALFMEPIYPVTCPEALSFALYQFTKERARDLKLPLFTIATEHSTYLGDDAKLTDDVLAYKGSDLWQYTDGGHGLIKGPFEITNVVLIN